MRMNDRPLAVGMAPQAPPVPEIEGFLKKLKRKTSNLSGSWNKRWFFVDHKRREFGYAKTKAPGAPRSSIYLNDITAVVQFDDTHFQVESRTRNFFLCGDSKACTTCWVKSLDEYRRKLSEYEKEKAKYDALLAAAQSPLAAEAHAVVSPKAPVAVAHALLSGESRQASNNKPAGLTADESRDSFSSSSSSSRGSSASSSASSSNAKRAGRAVERQTRVEERRTPSPAETQGSRDRDTSASRKAERQGDTRAPHHEREARERGRERGRERERERGDRARPSTVSRVSSRQFENRSISNASSVRAHPGKGYVMQAWVDEDL
ncbi:hypothetical protein PybrP1_012956 [[Pythium] brassicae (nom. inval.)]|nr:hypothetical protein PybrP1_012956 [[Pythium] brassicae (nom. inval.)]